MKTTIINLSFPVEITGNINRDTLEAFVITLLSGQQIAGNSEGTIKMNNPSIYGASIISEKIVVSRTD
jgi:hypothetical protein